MNQSMDLHPHITALLIKAGYPGSVESVEPLTAGGNNRTYRVATTSGVFAAKQYFRHSSDTRDRLRSEFDFLGYAIKVASSMVPMPYAIDRENGLALYEFVEGRPYSPEEIDWKLVRHAAEFFRALNSPQARFNADDLPEASEACFSIEEHLTLIGTRLTHLQAVARASAEDSAALALIDSLNMHWQVLAKEVTEAAYNAGLNPGVPLDFSQRCISPSDFGFHNAVRQPDGTTRFIDFEYAGTDDPAKMAGDFFAQIAVPVPSEFFNNFVREAMKPFPQPDELSFRAHLLRPVYQIKWCCIVLNVFLPGHLARRKFANPGLDEVALKRTQLAKAEALFQSLEPLNHGLH